MSNSKSNKSDQNKRTNSRRKGRNRRDERKELPVDDRRLDTKDRDNDPNWYFTSSELATQAGELSIQDLLGNGPVLDKATIPTNAVVYLNPSFGVSYSFSGTGGATEDSWRRNNLNMNQANHSRYPTAAVINDGANLMAFKMYTLMSSFTGRTQTYGPQDLLIMIGAIAEIAAISEHIRRIFGIALTVNARNRALPLGLMRDMGIDDVPDLVEHLADYRMQFNVQMTRINQVPLLDNIGFIRKSRDLYQKVYVDTDSPMAQTWFFAPYSTWVLDEESSPTGGFLKTVDLPHLNDGTINNFTMQGWLDVLTQQIDAVLSSSTMQIVYSDLINLANKVNVPTWQFDYLAENYVVLPEYNANANLQFHNMDVIGKPQDTSAYIPQTGSIPSGVQFTTNNDVVQDPGRNCIIYNPIFDAGSGLRTSSQQVSMLYFPHRTIVDFMTPNPSLEDKIEAMRFSCSFSTYKMLMQDAEATTFYKIGTYGPSISDRYVVSVYVSKYPDKTAGYNLPTSEIEDAAGKVFRNFTILDKFSCAPIRYIQGIDGSQSTYNTILDIAGDLNFFTTVDYAYLNRVNRLMYTGLFDFRV